MQRPGASLFGLVRRRYVLLTGGLMTKLGVVLCLIFASTMGWMTIGGVGRTPQRTDASGAAGSAQVVVRTEASSEAAWNRLRWVIAGVIFSVGIVLSCQRLRRFISLEQARSLGTAQQRRTRRPEARVADVGNWTVAVPDDIAAD